MSENETCISPQYRLIGDLIFAATGERPVSNTISRIALSGRLEAVKILGAWRCTEEAFQAYIQAPFKARNQDVEKSAVRTRTRTESARIRPQKEATDFLEANGIV